MLTKCWGNLKAISGNGRPNLKKITHSPTHWISNMDPRDASASQTPLSCALCSAKNWNCANVQKIDLEVMGSNVVLTGQIHSIKRRSKWMEKLISWKNRSWVWMARNTNIQREEKCWENNVWVWMAVDWFSLHFCQVASSAKNSATVVSRTKPIGHLPPS